MEKDTATPGQSEYSLTLRFAGVSDEQARLKALTLAAAFQSGRLNEALEKAGFDPTTIKAVGFSGPGSSYTEVLAPA